MFKLPSNDPNPSELKIDELEKSNEEITQEVSTKSHQGLLSKFSKSTKNEDFDMNEFDAAVNDSIEEDK